MKSIISAALFIHVIAGTLSLFVGIFLLIYRKKAGALHRRLGQFYTVCMSVVAGTALLFFFNDPTNARYQFFAGISMVSVYPTLIGWQLGKSKKGFAFNLFSFVLIFLLTLSSFYMLYTGLNGLFSSGKLSLWNSLFLLFSLLGFVYVSQDFRTYILNISAKPHWISGHGSKMTASLAAAMTAFCVNIVPRMIAIDSFWKSMAAWVLPGVLIGYLGGREIRRLLGKQAAKHHDTQKNVKIA